MTEINKSNYLSRREFIKAAGIVTGSALLTACAPDLATAVPLASTPETLKIVEGVLTEVTDEKDRSLLINSLPVNKPNVSGGDDEMKIYEIEAGKVKFPVIIYDLPEEDIAESITLIPPAELAHLGAVVTVQSVVLYASHIDIDGEARWERQAAMLFPKKNDSGEVESVEVKWFSNPDGFPSEGGSVDLTRTVLDYEIPQEADNPKFVFKPLVDNATLLPGWDGQSINVVYGPTFPDGFNVKAKLTKAEIEKPYAPVEAVGNVEGIGKVPFSVELDEDFREKTGVVGININPDYELHDYKYWLQEGEEDPSDSLATFLSKEMWINYRRNHNGSENMSFAEYSKLPMSEREVVISVPTKFDENNIPTKWEDKHYIVRKTNFKVSNEIYGGIDMNESDVVTGGGGLVKGATVEITNPELTADGKEIIDLNIQYIAQVDDLSYISSAPEGQTIESYKAMIINKAVTDGLIDAAQLIYGQSILKDIKNNHLDWSRTWERYQDAVKGDPDLEGLAVNIGSAFMRSQGYEDPNTPALSPSENDATAWLTVTVK